MPLRQAWWVGRSAWRTPGSIYLPELEIQYLLLCTRKSRYDDNRFLRTRRHVMIIGPFDSAKTTIAQTFIERFTRAQEYGFDEGGRPTMVQFTAGSTWEKQRGGISSDGRSILQPTLHRADYGFGSEMMTFLGSTPNAIAKRIEVCNPALEEANMVLDQLMGGSVSAKRWNEFMEWTQTEQGQGVQCNPELKKISYQCWTWFVFCTRELTPEQDQSMRTPGFKSRFVLAEWAPDNEEHYAYKLDQFGEPDKAAEEWLIKFNEFAWNSEYKFINSPPKQLLEKATQQILHALRAICIETGASFKDIFHGRLYSDVAQTFTAVALARQLWNQMSFGAKKAIIDGLDYHADDVERVVMLKQNYIANFRKEARRTAKKNPHLEAGNKALHQYLEFLLEGFEDRGDEAKAKVESFRQKPFVDFIVDRQKVSRPTAYNYIHALLEAGFIDESDKTTMNSVWLICNEMVLEAHGFKPSWALDEELEAIAASEGEAIEVLAGDEQMAWEESE